MKFAGQTSLTDTRGPAAWKDNHHTHAPPARQPCWPFQVESGRFAALCGPPRWRNKAHVETSDVHRIFVRAPNWVGDMVMATGALARIRSGFPEAQIVCGMRPYLQPLVSNSPYFDDVLSMPKESGWGAVSSFVSQVAAVRSGRFDLAIVLPNSQITGWVVRLAGVRWRLGYQQGRPGTMNLGLRAEVNRGLFARRIGPRRVPTPMPEYYDTLLDVINLPPTPVGARLQTSDAERSGVSEYLANHGIDPQGNLVLLNAGASFGPSKLWVAERWVELARHYQSIGMTPIFLSGPNETSMVRAIAAAAGVHGMTDPVRSLGMLKALFERARLLVSTDTGPRHLGVWMHVPTVCLMGPNDRRYTDYALDRQIVIQKDLECVPCQRKVCPLGTRQCMLDITVAEVVEAGERMMVQAVRNPSSSS